MVRILSGISFFGTGSTEFCRSWGRLRGYVTVEIGCDFLPGVQAVFRRRLDIVRMLRQGDGSNAGRAASLYRGGTRHYIFKRDAGIWGSRVKPLRASGDSRCGAEGKLVRRVAGTERQARLLAFVHPWSDTRTARPRRQPITHTIANVRYLRSRMRYFHHASKPGMTFAYRQTLAAARWGIPMLLLALIGIPKR